MRVLYDHWKIVLAVILPSVFAALAAKYRGFIYELIKIPISLGLALILVTLACVATSAVFLVLKRRKKWGKGRVPPVPPRFKYSETWHAAYGVKWKVSFGFDTEPGGISFGSHHEEPRLSVDGPYCERCGYELETIKSKFWLCVACKKKVSVPRELRYDTDERILKIFEAKLRSGKNGI